MEEIKMLKKWMKQPGNTAVKMAMELEYTSSTTINKWIERNCIPAHQRTRVLELITRKGASQK